MSDGSFVYTHNGQNGRIDVSKEEGKTSFQISFRGEELAAELTWDDGGTDSPYAHILYSDGVEIEGFYTFGTYADLREASTTDIPWRFSLAVAMCQIDREDWQYQGTAWPAIAGGGCYILGFLFFWNPEFAYYFSPRRSPPGRPGRLDFTESRKKAFNISGVIIMILCIVAMMAV